MRFLTATILTIVLSFEDRIKNPMVTSGAMSFADSGFWNDLESDFGMALRKFDKDIEKMMIADLEALNKFKGVTEDITTSCSNPNYAAFRFYIGFILFLMLFPLSWGFQLNC